MRLALDQARRALPDVPIGAVVLDETGAVITAADNRPEADGDPTAHAEILALPAAGVSRGRCPPGGCTLVVTLEPCTMCAGAAVLAGIGRGVFGAWDPKTGAAGSVRNIAGDGLLNHAVSVTGAVLEEKCGELIRSFFADKRAQRRAARAAQRAPAARPDLSPE